MTGAKKNGAVKTLIISMLKSECLALISGIFRIFHRSSLTFVLNESHAIGSNSFIMAMGKDSSHETQVRFTSNPIGMPIAPINRDTKKQSITHKKSSP
jgi:hypothetical protein